MNQSLAWLYGRQSGPAGDWLANALLTQGATGVMITREPDSGLVECGLSSLVNFLTGLTVSGAQESPFAMSPIESIVATLPPGLLPDNQLGPDGYPVNESGVALAWGNLLVNGYTVTPAMQQMVNTQLYNANATQITPGPPQTPGVTAKWIHNTFYPFGALIVDSHDNTQMALYNGITASTDNPPNWPTQPGALTGDNTQCWKLVAAGYQNIGWVATGFVFNLLHALNCYRVDLFVHSDLWYYQGSSSLQPTAPGGNAIPNAATWSLAGVHPGLLLAALYPASVSPPASGWNGTAIPPSWLAHTNLGVALAQTGNIEEAFAHYEQALRINPDLADTHYNLGIALERTGRMSEAIQEMEHAVRLRPQFVEARNDLGIALAQAGRYPEAVEHLERALSLNPDLADAHYNLGTVFAQLGRTPEAIDHLQRALRIDPGLADAHYNLGLALEKLGRTSEAIEHLQQALRIKPDLVPAQNALRQLQARK